MSKNSSNRSRWKKMKATQADNGEGFKRAVTLAMAKALDC